jgi:hypothetical protein
MILTGHVPRVLVPVFVGHDLKKCTSRRLSLAAVSHLRLDLSPAVAASTFGIRGELNDGMASTSGRSPTEGTHIDFPARHYSEGSKEVPMVRVRLSVHYRVHSRQMLCIGGSQIPFGWSFLSIAKVPMEWNPDDVWTTEVNHSLRVPRCWLFHFRNPGMAMKHMKGRGHDLSMTWSPWQNSFLYLVYQLAADCRK